MKIIKIMLVLMTLSAVAVGALGCGGAEEEAESSSQVATVQRGDITLEITAAGNLALAQTEDLIFDLFYAKGTVAEVMVEVGDTVTEGQVLATLDAAEWEDEIDTLETALSTAQRLVSTRERSLITAQRQVTTLGRQVTTKEEAITTAERQVASKELAVRQAQLDLDTANNDFNDIAEIKAIQNRIDNAQFTIDISDMMLTGAFTGSITLNDYNYWYNLKADAESRLESAQAEMAAIVGGDGDLTSAEVATQIAQAQLQIELKELALENARVAVASAEAAVEDARLDVEDARLDLEDAQVDVTYAQIDLDDAKEAVIDAQEALDEARGKSLEITAPFDSFVIEVNVAGGDEVLTGTVAIQLADPDKFEADILVSEMDIMQVSLGSQAWVSVDAMSGLSLPAEVTHISPTATIQSGVVNYTVRVEVSSLEASESPEGATPPEGMEMPEDFTPPEGMEMPEDFTPPEGMEMPEDFTPPEGMEFPASGDTSSQLPAVDFTGDIQLREGLTVTVSLIIAESTDTLLVPNGAVIQQDQQSYVQVVTATGETEQRAVTTGISNWQYTEITDGLSEGDQVLVTQSTSSSSTTQQGPGGFMMFGGP